MHFCLQYHNYSAYYASIMLDAFRHLLCSKLCWHNKLVPIDDNPIKVKGYVVVLLSIANLTFKQEFVVAERIMAEG